ncbi:hypothetical protein SAY87_026935 [Trapa incisa]|uniref:Uncharacterized protein n=1 Tax=Trapa incisa TaxID=236973 RepID=A0AAN7GMJ8_9MYRT|nr:hypothetical protein SAY87_026935 [Trapa incisa]
MLAWDTSLRARLMLYLIVCYSFHYLNTPSYEQSKMCRSAISLGGLLMHLVWILMSFPCAAAPVLYSPPPRERFLMARSVSMAQKKGYTSDEELEDLDSPLNSITDRLIPP